MAAGVLVVSTLTTAVQTQAQSDPQQPDSVVAIVADAQGLPFVPPDQRPQRGTYWEVRAWFPCLPLPLPCPPSDPGMPVYAIGGHDYLADDTRGELLAPLAWPYAYRLLGTTNPAVVLEAETEALQAFVARVQARHLNVQSSLISQTNSSGAGTEGWQGGGITLDDLTYSTNDLCLEIKPITNGTAPLVIHPPWSVTNGVYDLLYCTNLAPNPVWQRLLRTEPGQTNLLAPNATGPHGSIGSARLATWPPTVPWAPISG